MLLLSFQIPIAVVNTSVAPLFLAAIPERLFGRVMSVFGMLNQGTQMLSMIVTGWLASSSFRNFHARPLGVHLGSIDTILSVAALLIVLSGVSAFFTLPGSTRAAAEPDPG